ncbi:hypothetical protein BH23ACT1_BH23ACT1_13540 [soil metagenome]
MTATEPSRYRWSRDAFVRAWEAGAFDRRVELVEGEVWEVPIGLWHARMTGRVVRALPGRGLGVARPRLTLGQLPASAARQLPASSGRQMSRSGR